MTSEYVHGHEYDTYHYDDKKHKPQHFTVTRPEEHDIVSKGAYYHAHPREVGPSFAHHDEHHYYETEVDRQQWEHREPREHHYEREYEGEYAPHRDTEHRQDYEYELKGDHFGHNTEYERVHATMEHHRAAPHHADSWDDDLYYQSNDEAVRHYAPGEGTHFAHDPYRGGYYEPRYGHHGQGYGYANDEATKTHHDGTPKVHHEEKPKKEHHQNEEHDVEFHHGDHNIEHMDQEHHREEDHHMDVHHDLPVDRHHHEPEHIAEHHDSDHHDTHHEMEHGHHDTHYDSEHFYDSPYHHGGLHGHYEDPMQHEGGHSYYEDEEHVPHFTHHSEEPLTHTEEYYYGAPIHHYHHDYHHTDVSHSCWKKSYGRTAGEPLSSCADDKEKDGALCYPYC